MHVDVSFRLLPSGCLLGVRLDTFCHIIPIRTGVHLGNSKMLGKPDKTLNVNSMMDQREFMGKCIITRLLDAIENSDKRYI